MRKNFGAKPWSYPQPVYIIATYDENDIPNAMNAAWGGISNVNEISFCLAKTHKTVENLKKTGAFTVSIATEDFLNSCDYVGLVSGKKISDKFEKAGFHEIKSEFVNAPLIKELPMALECKVISYDDEAELLRGEIINVSIDEKILTEEKVDVEKLKPLIFDPVNMGYLSTGKNIGKAYSEGKKLIK